MKRAIKFSRPTKDGTKSIRQSKCGQYMIVKRAMASGKAGYFNDRQYECYCNGVWFATEDTLQNALDSVEFEHNPNWEPK